MKQQKSFPGMSLPIGKDKYTYAGEYIAGVILLVMILLLCLWPSVSDAQEKATGLKIGDQVPEITLNNITNYPTKTAKTSDFKGKLLILDFWATWCSPCVAMIPKMDSLQKEFAGKVQFLQVAYQPQQEVQTFLKRYEKQRSLPFHLPGVTDDKELSALFPHTYLPHYVWINPSGKVIAITREEQLTAAHIAGLLHHENPALPLKKDSIIPFNKQIPLLVNGNGGNGDALIYHSLLTGYTEGLKSGFTVYPTDPVRGKRISARNQPLLNLFLLAYGQGLLAPNRVIINVRDPAQLNNSSTGLEYQNWLRQNHGYSYELIAPPVMAARAFELMQQQLGLYFTQYTIRFAPQNTRCLALVRLSAADKIKARADGRPEASFDLLGCSLTNEPLELLVLQLSTKYLQGYPLPIIDQTGYTAKVDLRLQANLSDIESLNQALSAYDLQLVEKEQAIPMLVISDRVN